MIDLTPPAENDLEETRRRAITATDIALKYARQLGNDAAVWDLQAARKRLEKTDG